MILFTIYGLFTKKLYDGDGRKTPKYTKDETKEKIPRLVAPPRLRSGGRLFSDVRKHWKQAGPTLSGRGFLILKKKKKQGWARYGQLMAGNMDFVHVKFQDLQ